jgi:cyclohexanone monooxygenase
VAEIHGTAFDISAFTRECTPSYFNGEGSQKQRWYAGETYGPGWLAFEKILQEWRDAGTLPGMELSWKKS